MLFKVIQSHRFRYQLKAHICNFLLVINTNFNRTVMKLSQIIVQIWYERRSLCVIEPLWGP